MSVTREQRGLCREGCCEAALFSGEPGSVEGCVDGAGGARHRVAKEAVGDPGGRPTSFPHRPPQNQ